MKQNKYIDPYGIGVDSYSRMEVSLRNRLYMPRYEWLKQLGESWTCCDNINLFRDELIDLFNSLSREEFNLLMTNDEFTQWERLDDEVVVWRGCYPLNSNGLSWSLSRDVAKAFPFMNRYRVKGAEPLLLKGKVKREHLVLKLERTEQEVITAMIFDVESERLSTLKN